VEEAELRAVSVVEEEGKVVQVREELEDAAEQCQ